MGSIMEYSITWSSGDPGASGIYLGNSLVVSDWELREYFDTDAYDLSYGLATQKRLAWLHRESKRRMMEG